MRLLLYILIFSPLFVAAQTQPQQTRGEVYKAYASYPSQDLRETTIEVKRTMYGLKFKDRKSKRKYLNRRFTNFELSSRAIACLKTSKSFKPCLNNSPTCTSSTY